MLDSIRFPCDSIAVLTNFCLHLISLKFRDFPNFAVAENLSTFLELVGVSNCLFLYVSKFQKLMMTPPAIGFQTAAGCSQTKENYLCVHSIFN